MIMRDKPKNDENYIIVNSDNSLKLHTAGFFPKYIYDNINNKVCYIYYKKDNDILKYIKEHNISCIKE